MSETLFDVLVAGYKNIDTAGKDFDALVGLVNDKRVKVEAAILVAHDEQGNVTVADTGDHLGRKGLGWGGGAGVLIGLFAPPLLASVAVGASGGALVGKFANHKLTSGISDKIGERLPPGLAAIIASFRDDQRLAVEQALPGSLMKSLVQSEDGGLDELKTSLAEAMGKFNRDRTRLPIGDPSFGGTIGATLDTSVADWTINTTPSPPEGAPNVLLVLIDDAGFGNPSTFGGPIATPNLTRVAAQGQIYNRFHVPAMCSPTRAALLTGRDHHSVGFGTIAELPGRSRGTPARCRRVARHSHASCGQRLPHGLLWQVAPDA